MVDEQKPASSDIEVLKKELASIKNDMMRKELEEIKREKMREELEELKAEQAQKGQANYAPYKPKLSILTVVVAGATLMGAGYILGTVYSFDLAAEVEKELVPLGLPIGGVLLLTIIGIVLAFLGLGLITTAKR
jgi:hypothetical protein